jgi:tRNA(Ile2) C34 agmatinyltransferase TiaS
MKILIAIDDTDDLESAGTGEVLERLCAALRQEGLAESGFVSRHQLLIHEDIAYTSHNSAMCCEAETGNLPALLDFARAYMGVSCAAGADPGLCVVPAGAEAREELIAFGQRAKREVLKKADAYALAARFAASVFLTEHGGTGDGVIGALAGCGLRMSGNDGRIKGKLNSRDEHRVYTVAELCREYALDLAMDLSRLPVAAGDTVVFRGVGKAVCWGGRKAVYLCPDEEGAAVWRVLEKREIPRHLMD